jgi:hypothetical protein
MNDFHSRPRRDRRDGLKKKSQDKNPANTRKAAIRKEVSRQPFDLFLISEPFLGQFDRASS